METRAHHVLIGLFTVVVATAAMLFGLWLTKSSADREVAFYDVVFNEAVTGLSQGSTVQYNGIKIGDVTDLSLDKDDPRRVIARIRIDGDVPIHADTQARLRITGVTGAAVIQLSSGTPGSPLLAAEGDRVPVIVATPSPISQLLESGEDLMTNISELVRNARDIMSPENAQSLGHILVNLEQTTRHLAAQRDGIAQAVKQANEVGRTATETLNKAGAVLATADGLLDQQAREALTEMRAAMTALARTSTNIDQIVNDNRDALDGGLGSLNDVGGAVRELRATLATLRTVVKRLDDNPAEYLLGREKPREFTP